MSLSSLTAGAAGWLAGISIYWYQAHNLMSALGIGLTVYVSLLCVKLIHDGY